MLRGALVFWWARFRGRPKWSEGLRLSARAFLVVFRTDFVTFVWVSEAFEGVLALAGLRPENPKGGVPSAPLRTSLRPDTSNGMQNNLLRSILVPCPCLK